MSNSCYYHHFKFSLASPHKGFTIDYLTILRKWSTLIGDLAVLLSFCESEHTYLCQENLSHLSCLLLY